MISLQRLSDYPITGNPLLAKPLGADYPPGGGYSHTIPIRVCAAQRGRDFGALELERGIHFRDVS